MIILTIIWVWTSLGLAWEHLRGLRLWARLLALLPQAWLAAKVGFASCFSISALSPLYLRFVDV